MKPGGETTRLEFTITKAIILMPTKIVHLTHSMEIGGTEQVIMQLVQGLDATRFTNVITCIDGAIGEMGRLLEEQDYTIHSLSRNDGFDKTLIKDIRAILKSEKADIVHCHQYTPYCYGALAAIGLPTKVVFTEHGRFYPDVYTWKRRAVNQLLARLTDAIVSISEATRKALIKYEWLPASQISVIYNGMKLDRTSADATVARSTINSIQPQYLKQNDVVIGTVARLDPIKNHAMMIRTLVRLQKNHPNSRLVIVGDGPERGKLEQLVEEHDVQHAVLFTGFQNNTPDFISCFDIFLLTSDSEGTSMTLLEAMAFARPCIVTQVGGNPELIQQDRNGILIQRNDDEQLLGALESLLADRQNGNELGKQASKDFDARFELRHMIKGYDDLYTRLIARG